ncbi:MAG: hypothetical protein MK212_18325 [Saprospiraceae bacterium]|nr:hypothetical protein [Saprospiraceae bacterium]
MLLDDDSKFVQRDNNFIQATFIHGIHLLLMMGLVYIINYVDQYHRKTFGDWMLGIFFLSSLAMATTVFKLRVKSGFWTSVLSSGGLGLLAMGGSMALGMKVFNMEEEFNLRPQQAAYILLAGYSIVYMLFTEIIFQLKRRSNHKKAV